MSAATSAPHLPPIHVPEEPQPGPDLPPEPEPLPPGEPPQPAPGEPVPRLGARDEGVRP